MGSFYGAFIVDSRPGTPQARQAIKAAMGNQNETTAETICKFQP